MKTQTVTALYNCKHCKKAVRVEYNIESGGHADYWGRLPMPRYWRDDNGRRTYAGAWVQSCGGGKPTVYGGDPLGLCPTCGRAMKHGFIHGVHNADVPCDARCTGARGHNCECSCGGQNHGMEWA